MSDTTEKKIRIGVEDKASEALQRVTEKVNQLHVGLINMHAALEIGEKIVHVAEQAWEQLKEQLHHAVEEALSAEKAQNQLTGAMISSGQYTKENARLVNEHVEALEKEAGVNGETARSMIARGVQMELSIHQAEEMEQASRKLAAAMGGDVESAFSMLQASLAGNSRGLARILPQIKDFGAAQLKQGAAIDLVNKALNAQYELYQASLPAALDRVKVGYNNIYKEAGLVITSSPSVRAAVSAVGVELNKLAEFMKDNNTDAKAFVSQGLLLLLDALSGTAKVIDDVVRIGKVGFYGVYGALNALSLGVITLIDGPLALLYKGLSYLPKVGDQFNQKAEALIANAAKVAGVVNKSAEEINKAMAEPTEAYKKVEESVLRVRNAVVLSEAAYKANKAAIDEKAEAEARAAAAALKVQDSYDGYLIGTRKQREELDKQVADRDSALKRFTTYLEDEKRLAIRFATEKRMEVDKIRADALKGTGGSVEVTSGGNAEVNAEIKKQSDLQVLSKKHLLNKQQYGAAVIASEQRMAEIGLSMALAKEQAKADALGDSEAGFQLKQQLQQQHFEMSLQIKLANAQREGATQDEITAEREAANQENLANMAQQKEEYINRDIQQNELLNDQWAVSLGKIRLEQQKHGAVMGMLQGVLNSKEMGGAKQMFGNLASLRNSHSKTAFEIGKKAAIAEATISTFQSAVSAYKSMVGIPFVGPALGVAAAAAAIAAGFVNIQQINAQQFSPGGGQADSGMDSIPQSLDGRSFVMSGGERVVQPTANKDLTSFLQKEKSGSGSSTNNFYITVSAGVSREDARKTADVVIEELRRASSRGVPIISERGIVREG